MKYYVRTSLSLSLSSQYIIKVEFNPESMQFMEHTIYTLKTKARLAATVKLSQFIS